MKNYKITQYPAFTDNNQRTLTLDQVKIRKEYNNQRKGKIQCKRCGEYLNENEFYSRKKDKNGKVLKRRIECKDCTLRRMGVKEIGKQRFADKIEEKKFRRCSVCKEIKPILEFSKNKSQKNGVSNNCYNCSFELHKKYINKQRQSIGDQYIREYGKRNGIKTFDRKIIEELRIELEEKRHPKYYLDGFSFVKKVDIARYIENKYGNPITMTVKRLEKGYTEKECTISESENRSQKYTKGKIEITDTITGKVYLFKNTNDNELRKMVSGTTITEGLKTGCPIGGYRNSLYKNPVIIQRI